MKPNILIIMATYKLSGPGKNLFQYLQYAGSEDINYMVLNFIRPGDTCHEFYLAAKQMNININLLTQKRKLDPSLIVQTYNIVRENNFNIIQSHGYKSHLICLVLSRLFKIKWVAMAHGWTEENIKIRFYNKLEMLLLRYADLAIGVSPNLFGVLKKIRKDAKKTLMVLNAIECEKYSAINDVDDIRTKYAIFNKDIVIGVIGRLSPEKGQIYAIEAFVEIIRKYKTTNNIYLLLVGDGPDEYKLKQLTKDLGFGKNIIFAGYQSNIIPYMASIDLLLLPSLSEGLPNVVLEALCMRKPVVATRVGGIEEIIDDGDNGIIVNPGNVTEIADAILSVLSDQNIRQKLIENSIKNLYPKFSPAHRAKQLTSAYYDLVN